MKRRIIVIIVCAVAVFSLVFHYSIKKEDSALTRVPVTNEPHDKEDNLPKFNELPLLDLPSVYFSRNDSEWSGGKIVALDNKAVYQSYPTTKTTIEEYSSQVTPMSFTKYFDVRRKIQETDGDNSARWADDIYQKYGQLAVYFLSNYEVIEGHEAFDVDEDGVKEKILSINFLGRADGGSYSGVIIKGNRIIFSAKEDNSRIVPADTANGFYVEWRNPKDISPRCCEQGYLRTRFVYKNEKFVPIYEQEVKYLLIGKEE